MAGQLYRLIYRSTSAIVGTEEEIAAEVGALAITAGRNNRAAGLTGVLVHTGDFFTQVLEGELSELEACYDRISADLRHRAVDLIQFMPIPERSFDFWRASAVPQAEFCELWGDMPGRRSLSPDQLQPVLGRIVEMLRPAA